VRYREWIKYARRCVSVQLWYGATIHTRSLLWKNPEHLFTHHQNNGGKMKRTFVSAFSHTTHMLATKRSDLGTVLLQRNILWLHSHVATPTLMERKLYTPLKFIHDFDRNPERSRKRRRHGVVPWTIKFRPKLHIATLNDLSYCYSKTQHWKRKLNLRARCRLKACARKEQFRLTWFKKDQKMLPLHTNESILEGFLLWKKKNLFAPRQEDVKFRIKSGSFKSPTCYTIVRLVVSRLV
jgi:hypothetical protein